MQNLKEKKYLANFAFKPRRAFGIARNKKDSWIKYLLPLRKKRENVSGKIDEILYKLN